MKTRGFSLVEVLLAATIFGFFAVALIGAIVYGQQSTLAAYNKARASQLLDEGAQAAINIRGNAFGSFPGSGTYGLVQSGGKWTFSGSSDTTDIFTRSVGIFSNNAYTRSMIVQVQWPNPDGTTASIASVFRLKNWNSPVLVWPNAVLQSSLDLSTATNGLKVATQGNYAYIVRAVGTGELTTVDISNPAAPTIVSTLTLTNTPTNITVSGNYAYVTGSSDAGELQIVNISNPAAPSITRTYNAPGTPNGSSVQILGNYAYLTRLTSITTDELEVIDVTNPVAAATKVAGYSNNVNFLDITFNGNYAYIGTSSTTQEVLVMNVTNPASPTFSNAYNSSSSGTVNAVESFGSTLVFAQGTALVVYNITTPTAGVRLGAVTSTGTGTINDIDIDSTQKYVFLATTADAAEFQVANITTLTAPTISRVVDTTGLMDMTGVAYSTNINRVVGSNTSDTQEFQLYAPN